MNAVSRLIPILLLAFLAGCGSTRRAAGDGQNLPYTGPTLTLAELVEQINAYNARLPTLWSTGDFEATIFDPSRDFHETFVNGRVTLLYERPRQLRFVGRKDLAGRVVDLGSDGERFWLILPTEDLAYTGTFAGVDPAAMEDLPLRPDLLLEVLGVATIDGDLLAEPMPSLRFNPDADAYMLTFHETRDFPPRLVVTKEVWYDRQTLLPRSVLLFDGGGRVVLRAYLSNFASVPGTEGENGSAGMLARRYDLYFPESRSRMQLFLDDAALSRRGAPNERSFSLQSFGVSQVVDLDRQGPGRAGEEGPR